MPPRDDLPFVLTVEGAFRIAGRPETVITGIIEQGTLRVGDHLELIQPGSAGMAAPAGFECTWVDAAPRVTGRDPALGSPIAVMGFGIDPDAIRPGDKLQAAGPLTGHWPGASGPVAGQSAGTHVGWADAKPD